ncbi:hypothetical protein MXB_2830 [Myxobolus squamalis]|nr:hypothetical protein MXB_2830 [Myxobolus squamalis]
MASLIQTGINSLVRALEIPCQPGFLSFSQINWSCFDEVGDISSYVTIFENILNDYIPMIRNYLYLSEKYFDIFCINFVEFFTEKYSSDIFSTNSITSPGIQQLLLDIQLLTKTLLDSPSFGSEGYKPSKEFIEFLKARMKKLEMMLKVFFVNCSSVGGNPPQAI